MNAYLVVLSVVIALGASFAALFISLRLRNKSDHLWLLTLAAVLMGFAIAGMHYTGMIAATFVHRDEVGIEDRNLLVSSGLAAAVISTTLLILGLALAGSVGQRLWAQRRKRAEEILNKSEEKYRTLVDAVKDYAICMLSPDGFITTWNSGAERITGYKASEALGQPVSLFYTKEDFENHTAEEELRIAKMAGHFETEAQRVRRDGSLYWANIVISPLYEHDGKLAGFSKVTRDITQLREADLRLRKLNEELEKRVEDRTRELQRRGSQLSMITDALPVLVAQLDLDQRVLFINEAMANWFNRTKEQLIGLTLREVLGEERYPGNELYVKMALAGQNTTYERFSKSGDRSIFLSVTLVPEFDSAGRVVGFILVGTEVSKYKEIQAELKKAKEAAEVASETKSAFLANMSHEIRTPLGAILGFSELIMTQEMSSSERVNSFEVIKRNGRLLSNIINDILDLSKVEAGKLEMDKVDVPFTEVLTEIGTLLNLEAVEKGIKLTVTSEGMLPSFIRTDPLRLRQILLNIIGNAIKFTSRGSVDVKVKLVAGPDSGAKLAFIIQDTGEGISPEQAAKLFAPFTQADPSTTRRFGGTGLGLILSKKLATNLGGDVVLSQSTPGEGSTFVVTIDPGETEKVLFRSSDSSSPPQIIKMPIIERPDLGQMKVLVVDDSSDNQALIKKLLRLAGATVETADNGREGMEKALRGNYNLILMDLQMPEMDGYEATKALRDRGYKKPIIALTAHAMKEERRRCLQNGFNDHLTKPIDRDSLLHALAHYQYNA